MRHLRSAMEIYGRVRRTKGFGLYFTLALHIFSCIWVGICIGYFDISMRLKRLERYQYKITLNPGLFRPKSSGSKARKSTGYLITKSSGGTVDIST